MEAILSFNKLMNGRLLQKFRAYTLNSHFQQCKAFMY